MTARNTLFGLCEEWRRQTEHEGDAIRARDWPKVSECQEAKRHLQRSIVEWTAAARAETHLLGQSEAILETELKRLLEELMQGESRNQAWLTELKDATQTRRDELNGTTRNLRNVRRSYVLPNRTCWQSYS